MVIFLEEVALEIGPRNLFFSLWPTTSLEPWASVVRKLYQFIAEFDLRLLYTEARGVTFRKVYGNMSIVAFSET